MSALFPQTWFAAGVGSAGSAPDFVRFAAASPEKPLRHWRWLAFRDWGQERESLSASECSAAYELGEAEAETDLNLGTAMMCHAILQRKCPGAVRESAKRSHRAAVRRAAEKVGHSLRE